VIYLEEIFRGRSLRVPPPDLTRIAERNGGAFPFRNIYDIVDGRQPIAPGLPGRMRGEVVAMAERDAEEVVSLARGISAAVGLPLRCLSSHDFLSASSGLQTP
jgi:hypothetical protein